MNASWEQVLALLWRRSRFTSYFYQSARFVENRALPTLALSVRSDRTCLFYNPGFVDSLSDEERIGLLVHEMLHVVFSHRHRARPGEDLYLQNLAQDMVINSYMDRNSGVFFSRKGVPAREVPPLVLPAGLPRVPGAFYDETGIADPPWEAVYRWLKKIQDAEVRSLVAGKREEAPVGTGAGADELQRLQDAFAAAPGAPEHPEEGMSRLRLEGTEGLAFENEEGRNLPTGVHMMHAERAERQLNARRIGILELTRRDPAGAEERMFGELCGIIHGIRKEDTSSWRAKMYSIIDYSSRSGEWDYTYGRFNRRYGAGGIYAPGRVYKHRRVITVAVDVSGSMVMRPAEIESAFGVVEDLLGRFIVHLLCVDEDLFVPRRGDGMFERERDITKPFVYRKGDWRSIRTGSSGTTFFAPLFNGYIRGHRELLVVITDGYIYDLEKLRKYSPTLWVVSGSRTEPFVPPFGKKVEIGRF